MKLSPHFNLREFVGKDIYDKFGDTAIQFIDPRIVNLAEYYRTYFGKPVIINNWASGGKLNERGFRAPNTPTGAVYSQHKFGRAFDCHIDGFLVQEVYAAILRHPDTFIEKGLTTLENISATPTWLHSDCRDVRGYQFKGQILIVNP